MSDTPKTLQDTFGAKTDARVTQDYAANADVGAALVAKLRALLADSATAQRLIKMADAQGVALKTIRGRDESFYVPETKTIFLSISPKTTPNATLALLYAGALREVEQNLLGFSRPGADVDDDSWVTQHAVKNVDIIRNICIIADESVMKQPKNTDFLDSLTALGHNDIYKAVRNKASDQELLTLYAKQENIETKG